MTRLAELLANRYHPQIVSDCLLREAAMYAVVEDGSRQYRVTQGDRLRLDYREVAIGEQIELTNVLLYVNGDTTLIGQPKVAGARVIAEVIGDPTVKHTIQQFRRRKNYRKLRGHTQPFIEVRVRHILKAGEEVPQSAVVEPPPAPAPGEPTPAPASSDSAPAPSEAPAS